MINNLPKQQMTFECFLLYMGLTVHFADWQICIHYLVPYELFPNNIIIPESDQVVS